MQKAIIKTLPLCLFLLVPRHDTLLACDVARRAGIFFFPKAGQSRTERSQTNQKTHIRAINLN